jgi:hypothetical protein
LDRASRQADGGSCLRSDASTECADFQHDAILRKAI